ncbi:16S rRNA (cytosine(1402)-N(4))-methyltransferase RsmH [Candidatus Parcubacteria bacterium]|nr:16S rRNA (cytosine(1402)-N(4))-methyltransferase RsmH [Candidatus Parcubacteria bacterium]
MHIPVLLHEAIDGLDPKEGETAVDATLGGAGHAKALLARIGKKGTLLCLDADEHAIARGKEALKGAKNVKFLHGNFRNLLVLAAKAKVKEADRILFDLGLSSFQFDESGRGFSFRRDEPLKMTLGEKLEGIFDAAGIVNGWDEENLREIIASYGEERFSGRIARAIVAARPLANSLRLAEVIENAVPAWYRGKRIHPATRTFQAIRMAVNEELSALKEGLDGAMKLLAPKGRLAVISFHSGEDRIVKRFMQGLSAEEKLRIITKKPIVPSDAEAEENPRSRSAKLRIAEKL